MERKKSSLAQGFIYSCKFSDAVGAFRVIVFNIYSFSIEYDNHVFIYFVLKQILKSIFGLTVFSVLSLTAVNTVLAHLSKRVKVSYRLLCQ